MTMLAPPPPHLARLFSRLDSADASDPVLQLALQFWRDKRDGRVMPQAEELAANPDMIAPHVFMFRRVGDAREWEATGAGPEAAFILGMTAPDKRLSKLLAPRLAARLRRLLEAVAETAEPLAAAFEFRVKPGRRQWIEFLAAPISSDGRRVDGVYGGVVARLERANPADR
ncbi:PAS domain-containing protein [Methylocapsa acidiphila]|uniref:PAS domain-containing protein n=1 Tax=Methylocapsa acidiphila TaxID=133552 RepID=UPI000403B161|nr:PAS domain-containing protein [Methylocapsa acidiphila]